MLLTDHVTSFFWCIIHRRKWFCFPYLSLVFLITYNVIDLLCFSFCFYLIIQSVFCTSLGKMSIFSFFLTVFKFSVFSFSSQFLWIHFQFHPFQAFCLFPFFGFSSLFNFSLLFLLDFSFYSASRFKIFDIIWDVQYISEKLISFGILITWSILFQIICLLNSICGKKCNIICLVFECVFFSSEWHFDIWKDSKHSTQNSDSFLHKLLNDPVNWGCRINRLHSNVLDIIRNNLMTKLQ